MVAIASQLHPTNISLGNPAQGALIMGVDPGSIHTGYGLILSKGSQLTLVAQGRLSPRAAWPMPKRLAFIHQGLSELMTGYRPQVVAVEDIFCGSNVRSALKLGQVRGVILLTAALLGDIEIFEYAPRQVKSAVAGYGQAEKTQVAHMVGKFLNYSEKLAVDAADALAVAICHAGQCHISSVGRPTSRNSWRNLSPEELDALSFRGKGGKV